MTIEEMMLKELKAQTDFLRANTILLTEIKFELQNARKMGEYKISLKTPGLWDQFRYWAKGKMKG